MGGLGGSHRAIEGFSTVTTRKKSFVDYQGRATAFHIGDCAFPIIGGSDANGGTVVAVWPAIGMVDLVFPYGTARYPVEELVISHEKNEEAAIDIAITNVPGGAGTVSVSGGPGIRDKAHRVASAYIKQAVYWASKDRQYKPTREEIETGDFCCPRCEENLLRRVSYKREQGKSVKLWVCPSCLFLIRDCDLVV